MLEQKFRNGDERSGVFLGLYPDLLQLRTPSGQNIGLRVSELSVPSSLYLFSSEWTVYNSCTVHLGIRYGKLLVQQRTYDKVAVEFE